MAGVENWKRNFITFFNYTESYQNTKMKITSRNSRNDWL